MADLSDIVLFSKYDLKGNPVEMNISNTLDIALNKRPFDFNPSAEPQCGTISMKLDKSKWDEVIKTLDSMDAIWQKHHGQVEELCKRITKYLEDKCEAYCIKNNIPIDDWYINAHEKSERNLWEMYYKDELVCGAKVISELTDTDALKASVNLELY
jgi:hypothetical protein